MTNDIIELVSKVGETMEAKRWMLATAESCTGGAIAYSITEVPGSGDWFDCGFVTYTNTAKADMLDVAFMGLHVGQLSSRADMAWCFEAVTANSARIMGLEGYGLDVGCKANMVLLQAKDPIEAIRLRAHRIAVIRGGRVIARNEPLKTQLSLSGRPESVDPADTAS